MRVPYLLLVCKSKRPVKAVFIYVLYSKAVCYTLRMPRPQPANERAVSPHSRNERITREWYQENPEKVRSAQSEAENIHMVAAIKVEESLESVFAELGIANAGYTFRYLNES